VGAAVGAAFLLFRGGIKRGLLVLLPAAALVAVVVLQQEALTNRVTSILEITELPRWRLWQTAIRIVADHPILGAGLGAYPTLFPIYKVPGHYMATGHPHHDILNAAVETGVVGALIWLGIWAAFFRETRRASGAAIDWVVEGSRAAVLALLVAGLAQCFSTDEEVGQVWFFVMTAALIDVSRRAPRRRPAVRQLEQWFKRRSLPLARSLLARGPGSAASEDTSSERILVVRPDDRLGNLLLLAPFLQALREVRPQARIGMLVGSRYRDILRAWPWVDVWVVQDKPAHLRRPPEFARWIRSLRRDRWTVALEMSNHNTHSYYSCLLTLASGAPRRIGFDEPRNQGTLTDPVAAPDVDTHFSLAPIALLEAAGWGPPGVPGPVMRCPLPSPPVGGYASSLPPNYLVVHLGGRGEKALAPALWAAVIRTLLGHHRGHVVVLAGPDEQELIPSPAPEVADRVVVAPSLDLITLGHVIADARSYVGCDTGVMHLAVAVGTPTVALFFRSNPLHYAPLGAEHATVLLANPYGVTDAAWDTLQRGLVRSRLLRADEESPDSMRGVPASGPRALAAIDAACRHALRTRPEDRPEDQAKEVRS
jgi:ADP-heptose:LPS heptosyltransferase